MLKGSMNNMWNLYFTLQIICYLTIYDISFPANTEIYLVEFVKLLEFEFLKPDKFIQSFIYSDFSYAMIFKAIESKTDQSPQQEGVMQDLIFVGFITICLCMGCCCLCCVACLKKYQEKVAKILQWIFNKMVFNGIIRSILISYVVIGKNGAKQIKTWI